jgi:ribosomal protein L6P/L9E
MYINNITKISNWIRVSVVTKFKKFNYIFVFGILGFIKYKMRKEINIFSKYKKIRIYGPNISLYYTYTKILNNLFQSVLTGHLKYLELKGVGFKYKLSGNKLFCILGYSHVISYFLPSNILVVLINNKLLKLFSNNLIILNKVIYDLKKKKKINVYKGKGIIIKGEVLIMKEGKKSNAF